MTRKIFDIRGIRKERREVGRHIGLQIVEEHQTHGTPLLYRPELTKIIKHQEQKMREFYEQSTEVKNKSARPESHHQTGWTPAEREVAKETEHREPDPKERYFYPAYDFPSISSIYEGVLYLEKVVPEDVRGWQDACDEWCFGMTEVATDHLWCLGLALRNNEWYFLEAMNGGAHLVASTYCRYEGRLTMPGAKQVIEHLDLNLCSYHVGTTPGLYTENPQGNWEPTDIPDDCVGVQAAEQMQLWTKRDCKATLTPRKHMVITDPRVLPDIASARREGRVHGRVANQFFCHSDPHAVVEGIELGAQVVTKLLDIGLGSEKDLQEKNPAVWGKVQEYREYMKEAVSVEAA